jgi:DNA-binding NarL/FixJ family response regulator
MSPGESAPRIHVAIVEDDLGFRSALARALLAAPDMKLAGTAGTKAEGIALLQGPPVDVLLVDLGLPDGSGIEVIRAAARQWPSCSIMVSTNFGDETHVMRSIEAGAAGYLLKDSSQAKIVDEIRSLASGGSPISPIIARQVLARFRQEPPRECHRRGTGCRANRSCCRRAKKKCWTSSPKASPRWRSPSSWACRISRCAPLCAASTASSRSPPRPKPFMKPGTRVCWQGKQASGAGRMTP